MKLFRKLLLTLLPLSMFFIIGLWLSIYSVTASYVEEKVQDDLKTIAQLRVKEIETWVEHTRQQLESFNSRLLVRKILAKHLDGEIPTEKHAQLVNIVSSTQDMVDGFDSMHLLAQNGNVAYSTDPDLTGQAFEQFDDLLSMNQKLLLARPLPSNPQNLLLRNAIQLIYEDKTVGYLVVDTRAESLINSLNSNIGLGNQGRLMLFGKNSKGQATPVIQQDYDIQIPVAFSSTRSPQGSGFTYTDLTGSSYTALYAEIDKVNWQLILAVPNKEAFSVITNIRFFGLIGVIACILLMVIALIYVAKKLSHPIESLVDHALDLRKTEGEGQFTFSGISEYDRLALTLNNLMDELLTEKHNLEDNVANRTQALTLKNHELNTALSELKNTQQMLVETEKMAALGEMVAGVAHEVNTPLGSALGAATHLMEVSQRTQQLYDNENLTEDDFETLLNTNKFSADIVVSNLKRAADLVRSFKRVAADRSSEKVEHFDLVEYIKDVLISLKPKHKHMALHIEFSGKEALKVQQIPGIIAQVVTNLVVNAIVHAFENKTKGTIRFNIEELDAENIVLEVQDNGSGMTEEVTRKLFEPFFTTKRGKGGTGLGLNIVYNLMSKSLKGQISVESKPNQGSKFIMVFPISHESVEI